MIDWVENGVKPNRLNATVSSGDYEGEVQELCMWPRRVSNNASSALKTQLLGMLTSC